MDCLFAHPIRISFSAGRPGESVELSGDDLIDVSVPYLLVVLIFSKLEATDVEPLQLYSVL